MQQSKVNICHRKFKAICQVTSTTYKAGISETAAVSCDPPID